MINSIIQLLTSTGNKNSIEGIERRLNIHNFDLLKQTLETMVEQETIAITSNNNIYLLTDDKYHHGKLKTNPRGFGFVNDLKAPDHDDYFVPPVSMNGAISMDTVIYTAEQESDDRWKASVIDIEARQKDFIVGEITKSNDGRFLDFIPTDQSLANFRVVMVNKQDFQLTPNMLIKAKILDVADRKLFVRIKKIIGNSLKAADRIISIAEEFNIKTEFLTSTLKNAEQVNIPVVHQQDEIKRRQTNSIIDKLMVTIDGNDSKDLDDSIFVERSGKGYKLIVAIADVSYYVKPKTPLDTEALIRGNSTYLANKVLPMLPKILSDDLCSLNPNTEKFALACEMLFDQYGAMLQKRVFETTMISQARLTYDEVNLYFKDQTWSKQNEVAKMLDVARELHLLIDQQHLNRGTINMEISEPKVIMDKDSNVLEIKARTTGESEKLIENFMVSANEAVAELVFEKELPFIYRDHDKPAEEDLIEWYGMLKSFGINTKLTDLEMTDPKNLNKTLAQINLQTVDPILKELLNISLLRHMSKAKYAQENIGHFGLGSQCYTHFTSPIRRYSDLMVHRYLKQYIIENNTDEKLLEQNSDFINKACLIINDTEINSVDCEREVVKVCMIEYLKDKIGQVFEGTISATLKFGLFVQLDNMVEGLIHISTLGDGLVYDEKALTLIKPNNTFFRMGQKVQIRIVNANIKTRKIDFELVK